MGVPEQSEPLSSGVGEELTRMTSLATGEVLHTAQLAARIEAGELSGVALQRERDLGRLGVKQEQAKK